MKKLPISLLFATTSKGHFDRTDIYKRTLEDWLEQEYLDLFSFKRAHIKDGGESSSEEMKNNIISFGFNEVLITKGEFKHFHPSHSIGQLQDIGTLINGINTPYVFFLEDDFLLRPKTNNLFFHIKSAIDLLSENGHAIQVRIPRHLDDFPHYPTLTNMHNGWKSQNDIFSFNPYIARTKDIQNLYNSVAANQDLILDLIQKQILNSELTFTTLSQQMRGKFCFYSFDSQAIQCFHIGTKFGEEDQILN